MYFPLSLCATTTLVTAEVLYRDRIGDRGSGRKICSPMDGTDATLQRRYDRIGYDIHTHTYRHVHTLARSHTKRHTYRRIHGHIRWFETRTQDGVVLAKAIASSADGRSSTGTRRDRTRTSRSMHARRFWRGRRYRLKGRHERKNTVAKRSRQSRKTIHSAEFEIDRSCTSLCGDVQTRRRRYRAVSTRGDGKTWTRPRRSHESESEIDIRSNDGLGTNRRS